MVRIRNDITLASLHSAPKIFYRNLDKRFWKIGNVNNQNWISSLWISSETNRTWRRVEKYVTATWEGAGMKKKINENRILPKCHFQNRPSRRPIIIIFIRHVVIVRIAADLLFSFLILHAVPSTVIVLFAVKRTSLTKNFLYAAKKLFFKKKIYIETKNLSPIGCRAKCFIYIQPLFYNGSR